MNANTALPWYRHRWPWLLMAGPGIVVLASFITLWYAIKSNDGLVAEDYYKKGVAINMDLARSDRARLLALTAEVDFAPDQVSFKLKSRDDLPGRIRATIAHPTRAGYDQTLMLTGVGGVYRGALAPLQPGRWQVILTDDANTWRMSSEIQLPEQQHLIITPTEAASR